MISLIATAALATPPRGPDFDGDGFQDLAIGVPDENVGGWVDAGSLVLLYGDSLGLDTKAGVNLALWQSGTGVDGTSVDGGSASNEHFGAALAWGDFNGDCFDDLAVGVPGTIVAGGAGAGVVQIFYGSVDGPSTADDTIWHRDTPDMVEAPAAGDGFGAALAAGDFDQDGFDDLAVGVPGDNVGAIVDAGSVQVLYGSAAGFDLTRDLALHRSWATIGGTATTSDAFGYVLTAGDFNCDGFDDLGVSSKEKVGLVSGAGAVHVIPGRWDGIAMTNDVVLTKDSPLVDGSPLANGWFGKALVAGNIDDDFLISECDDLVVASNATIGGAVGAGDVNLFMGDPSGPVAATVDQWSQDNLDGSPDAGDAFGTSLALGEFDNDANLDLAVGVMEDSGEGAIHVVTGTATGLTTTDQQLWTRASPGIGGVITSDDEFGHHLTVGDYDGDGESDLVVAGDPAGDGSGEIVVLYTDGLSLPAVDSAEDWDESKIGATSTSAGDGMGRSLVPARRKDTCP